MYAWLTCAECPQVGESCRLDWEGFSGQAKAGSLCRWLRVEPFSRNLFPTAFLETVRRTWRSGTAAGFRKGRFRDAAPICPTAGIRSEVDWQLRGRADPMPVAHLLRTAYQDRTSVHLHVMHCQQLPVVRREAVALVRRARSAARAWGCGSWRRAGGGPAPSVSRRRSRAEPDGHDLALVEPGERCVDEILGAHGALGGLLRCVPGHITPLSEGERPNGNDPVAVAPSPNRLVESGQSFTSLAKSKVAFRLRTKPARPRS